MEANPIHNDARKAQRARRLGPDAACARCGITTPETLLRVNRSLLEAHHPGCAVHEPSLTISVCRNCHAELTEGQRDAGVTFQPQPTLLERLAAMLHALGTFFHDLGDTFTGWAAYLSTFIIALDVAYPAWRQMPEAYT